jgi:DNA-binding HxlR family transcriptional regulator
VRIEYQLTEKGQDLSRVVEAISEWSARWACEEIQTADVPELVVISSN